MEIPNKLTIPAVLSALLVAGLLGCPPASGGVNGEQELTLYEGWNFIALPYALPQGTTLSSVFSAVDKAGHSSFRYDAGSHLWVRLGDQDPLPEPLNAFWIYSAGRVITSIPGATGDTAPVSRSLSRGWNAIGFPGEKSRTARSALSMVGSGWTQLIGYSSQAGSYDTPIIRGGTGLFSDIRTVDPWKGYWLYMNEEGTLSDPDAPPAMTLVVTFFSVGDGDSVLIRTPGGKKALLDTGNDTAGLASALQGSGIVALDAVLLSGPVRNPALGEFLDRIPTTLVIGPPCESEESSCPAGSLAAIATGRGVAYERLAAGESIDLDTDCTVTSLYSAGGSEGHDGSVVYLLQYGSASFLFTGEALPDVEDALARNSTAAPITVLQVSGHGDAGSSSDVFLSVFTPSIAVVGLGDSPQPGVPSDETLRRLAAAGATLYRTDYNGDITIFTTPSGYTVLPSMNNAYLPPAVIVTTAIPSGSSGGGCPYCKG